MNVILLDPDEKFIEFLDPDLLEFKETHEEKGIRRGNISYIIEEINHAKEIFKPGNKIWVQNGRGIEDCLYVIPDNVNFNLYQDNIISFYADEVLVELNFAPPFKQTDLKIENGFTLETIGSQKKVTVNRNALEFWFGNYFDIGLIQDCLSENISNIAPTGTMTLMSLLRYIEEETSNIFVTRYEKDPQKNIIRRYLDFLNPSNITNNWSLKVEFENIFEELGYNVPNETIVSEVIRNIDDTVNLPNYSRERINFNNLNLRIILNDEVLVEFPLVNVGLSGNAEIYTFLLAYQDETLTVNINGKTITSQVSATEQIEEASVSANSIEQFNPQKNVVIPNGSVFEIVDESVNKVIYSTKINPVLGNVQPEILDLTRNVEDIDFEIDEEDTYNAIAPILKVNESSTDPNSLTRDDYDTIINQWVNLSVKKGEKIPMIVERVYVTAPTWDYAVKNKLGRLSGNEGTAPPHNVHDNYWWKPIKQNNQIDESEPSNNQWEVFRATAYWIAPFNKKKGEIFVADDTDTGINYNRVLGKSTVEKVAAFPKIGTVETSDEDRYAIFNAVCLKLKDKRYPSVNVKADVANFRNGFDNNYKVYDTVFIKIPGVSRLVKARVIKTSKNPKNVLENTVELGTYSISSKAVQKETEIVVPNLQLQYPQSAQLPFTLLDDEGNPLAKKLLTFALYKVDESGTTSFVKSYMKGTNGEGIATYPVGFKPGNYILNCTFGGDLVYSSSANSSRINVSGTKVVQKNAQKTSASKKSTTKATPMVQTYYDQYGRSPDGQYIMAIGLPATADEISQYGNNHWECVFINRCPKCGKDALFWGYRFDTYFRDRLEEGGYEGAVYCDDCGARYSIFGHELGNTSNKELTLYREPVISSHNKAQTLKNGLRPYNVITENVKVKNVTSERTRIEVSRSSYPLTDSGEISRSVRSMALSVVGDSTGVAAAKKIVVWVAANIKNENRNDFYQSPEVTLKRKMGNGCCQADLICQMCDAAGVQQTVEVRYVHVHKPGTGHVFLRINGTWVDSTKKESPWGNYCTGYGSISSANITLYPGLPFERSY